MISGCANEGDEDYALAEEQYAMGWILHNINDSTPTELNFSINDVATYNYLFNYPAGNSSVFYNVLFWLAPVHINASDTATEPFNEFFVPLNRTYYVMGINPVPENYQTNWSFANQMIIDYYPDISTTFEEYDFSSDAYNAVMPVAEDIRTVYFGTAPFLPAPIHVDGENITFTDRLIKGYLNTSYLVRWVGGSEEFLIPKYEIYLNGTLNHSGNFSSSWGYYDALVNYSLPANGTYRVNITIPTGYPVWNMTQLLVTINTPSQDVAPPVLTHIDANPYFEHNKSYSVKFNITDNTSVGNVSAYYRESDNWIELSMTNVSETYNTSINVTNSSIEKIDLKIAANDTSGNRAEYIIMPVALTKISPVIALTPVSVIEGGQVTASGNITDSYGTGIRRLRLYFFVDNNYTSVSKTDSSGIYSVPFNVSCGTSDINFSMAFNGSGIYGAKEQQFQIERVLLNFSVNSTSFIHQSLPLNFTAAGATITINRTDINWSYSALMASDKFAFTPRNYGNYTITMNSTCTNTAQDVFVNTTQVLNISSPEMSLPYPLENTTFTATISMESQARYYLGANISNSSSSSEALNISWTGQSLLDTTTSEPYNGSSNTWVASINAPAGKYNITASLADDAEQAVNKSTPIYVFPAVNATFNITNHTGQANNRIVSVRLDSEDNIYGTYNITGASATMIPNNSYFYPNLNMTLHVFVQKKVSASENISVMFLNSTIQSGMNIATEYSNVRKEFSDKIIYAVYSYSPEWDYNSTLLSLQLNASTITSFSETKIYSCENWTFSNANCDSGWSSASTTYKNLQGSNIVISATSAKTQAFALGESAYCGDGYCSAFESCSSCVTDCGSCGTSPPADPPAAPSGGGDDTSLKAITITPNEIITKISVALKTEILGPSLTVSKLSSSSVGAASGRVYHYFEISTVNITDSNIENTTIEFKVNNSWIVNNNVDQDSITLNRYTTQWTALPTTKKSNDGNYAYYFAETPGFSLFAITGSEVGTQQSSTQANQIAECPVCPKCGEWSECVGTQKTRTCYKCDAETGYICQKYSDIKGCDAEQATTPGGKSSFWKYVLLAIVVIVIAVIALSIVPNKGIQPIKITQR